MESLDGIEEVFAVVDNNILEEIEVPEPRNPKVYFRDVDPFNDYSEDCFKKRFRFSKNVIHIILPKITGFLESETQRGLPITPLCQLLTALRFYATGSFQIVCGDIMHISQLTVCNIVKRVSRALAMLMPDFIKFPANLRNIKAAFENLGCIGRAPGLKNIVGAIDCTHIKITKPRGIIHTKQYRNRKGYFSLNVQVVGGPNLIIYDIVARWAGSTHDSRIFRNSRLNIRLSNNEIDGMLLADGGYTCTRYLLTPILNPRTAHEERYNKVQIKIRNSVERLFGVWKRRFPCLQIGLATKLSTTANIIIACAVLHNIAIGVNDTFEVRRC
ncbi:putative nuclease HARBI1 [Vanessa cardui]|uniref:putative nuclease HARBI1 n=1 Tax=Vanessa cardui TaxID=171605 RepID=UPI001F13202A|nr:putative nuclease HARBI1 [Vanessa cardui]